MLQNFCSTTTSWLESISKNVTNVARRVVGGRMQNIQRISAQESEKFEPLLGGGADIRNRRQLLLIDYLAKHQHATRAQLDTLLEVENSPDIISTLRKDCFWDIQSVRGAMARWFNSNAGHVYYMPPVARALAKDLLKCHGRLREGVGGVVS